MQVSGPDVELEYQLNGTGPLSSPLFSGAALWSTTNDHDWPNALLQLLPSFRPNWSDYDDGEDPALIPYSATIVINHGLPKSEGNIRLKSSNPFDPPEIDVKYFDVEQDLKDMVEMLKFSVPIMEGSTSFAKFGTRFWDGQIKSCEMYEGRSDEYYGCYLKHYGSKWIDIKRYN
jgi:hypothetical protein